MGSAIRVFLYIVWDFRRGGGAGPVPALLILCSTAIIRGKGGGRLPRERGGLLYEKWF